MVLNDFWSFSTILEDFWSLFNDFSGCWCCIVVEWGLEACRRKHLFSFSFQQCSSLSLLGRLQSLASLVLPLFFSASDNLRSTDTSMTSAYSPFGSPVSRSCSSESVFFLLPSSLPFVLPWVCWLCFESGSSGLLICDASGLERNNRDKSNSNQIKSIHNEENRGDSVEGVQVRRRIDDMLCSLLRLLCGEVRSEAWTLAERLDLGLLGVAWPDSRGECSAGIEEL